MPTFNTDTYAAQVGANPRNRIQSNVAEGELRVAEIEYVAKGTEVASDKINIVQLPYGAVILTEHCAVINEAAGTTTISKIGDAKVDNRYQAAAIDLATAALTAFTVIPANRVAPWSIDKDTNTIIATVTAALTAGKKVRFKLVYRV